jgi:DMSO reductase anchor subunit
VTTRLMPIAQAAARVSTRAGRTWHFATFLAALAALILQFTSAPINAEAQVSDLIEYFTVDCLVILTASTGFLAFGVWHDRRIVRDLRFVAVTSMTAMTVVYATMVRGAAGTQSWAEFSRHAAPHYLLPTICVGGWALFGPRGWVDRRSVAWAILWPVGWCCAAFVRGGLTGYYPYRFMDLNAIGYVRTTINLLAVLGIVSATAAAGLALDSRVRRERTQP